MYKTVTEIREANRKAGQHFFDPDTMRFFRSRVGNKVYGGEYFITSEQFDIGYDRRYTVRRAKPNGHIETVGDMQGFPTHRHAAAAIRDLLGTSIPKVDPIQTMKG